MANPPAHVMPMAPSLSTTAAVKMQEPWVENLSLNLMCRECKEDPPNIVEDFSAGDTVCGSCGLVLGDRIVDTRSEWRTFTNDDQNNDDPSRVGDGANPLLNGAQLQTDIAFVGGASAKSRDLSRAQNKATHDKSTKTLLAAYKEIGSLCDGIGIPKNVSDTAKHLFKIVHDENAFRGKSQETVIAGCIFIACRQCKVPRTFREIFDLTKVSKPEIGRVFKNLEKFFAGRNEKMKASIVEAGGEQFPSYLISLVVLQCSSFVSRYPGSQWLRVQCCRGVNHSKGPLPAFLQPAQSLAKMHQSISRHRHPSRNDGRPCREITHLHGCCLHLYGLISCRRRKNRQGRLDRGWCQ